MRSSREQAATALSIKGIPGDRGGDGRAFLFSFSGFLWGGGVGGLFPFFLWRLLFFLGGGGGGKGGSFFFFFLGGAGFFFFVFLGGETSGGGHIFFAGPRGGGARGCQFFGNLQRNAFNNGFVVFECPAVVKHLRGR